MFVQSFVGTLWQTIFDSAAYKRQVLNIVPYEISESKGQHIYISYCASCHHKVFELVKSKNYPSRDLTMFHYLNTAHPIVRFNFDSSDIKSLRAYFEPSLDKGEDFDSN
ncbi:hypothetical protein DCM91_13135 [Chitinophaga costaii]|nr:hypothetical protein DCM91_13135 [Chitinophaga costaii]